MSRRDLGSDGKIDRGLGCASGDGSELRGTDLLGIKMKPARRAIFTEEGKG